MRKFFATLLLLLPLTATAQVDNGLNDNFNKSLGPMEKQFWLQEHAGRDKATLTACNVPGEYDCNLRKHGFRTCSPGLQWGKWIWMGSNDKPKDDLNYQNNCLKK